MTKPLYITVTRYKERNELHMSIKDGGTGDAIDYPLIGHREIERLLGPAVVRLVSKARAASSRDERGGTVYLPAPGEKAQPSIHRHRPCGTLPSPGMPNAQRYLTHAERNRERAE